MNVSFHSFCDLFINPIFLLRSEYNEQWKQNPWKVILSQISILMVDHCVDIWIAIFNAEQVILVKNRLLYDSALVDCVKYHRDFSLILHLICSIGISELSFCIYKSTWWSGVNFVWKCSLGLSKYVLPNFCAVSVNIFFQYLSLQVCFFLFSWMVHVNL